MNTAVQTTEYQAFTPVHNPEDKGVKAQTTVRSVTQEQMALVTSTFGTDIELSGKYNGKIAESGLCVMGSYTGSISYEKGGVVHIAQGASVIDTEIIADVVVLEGTFSGSVKARRILEILPTAEVSAELRYAELDVHRGAKVSGSLEATTFDVEGALPISTKVPSFVRQVTTPETTPTAGPTADPSPAPASSAMSTLPAKQEAVVVPLHEEVSAGTQPSSLARFIHPSARMVPSSE